MGRSETGPAWGAIERWVWDLVRADRTALSDAFYRRLEALELYRPVLERLGRSEFELLVGEVFGSVDAVLDLGRELDPSESPPEPDDGEMRLARLGVTFARLDLSPQLWLQAVSIFRRLVVPRIVSAAEDERAVVEGLEATERLAEWIASVPLRYVEAEQDAVFLRSIVENIPLMIFVKRAEDLTFIRFNRAGEELLGYDRSELIGKSDYDFFPAEEADFFVARDREVLAQRGTLDIPEEPILTRDRGLRYLHTRKIAIVGPDGEPRFLMGISEDVTERKQTLEALERARRAAEAASQAKTDFLARMSHEVRTPMNGIIGLTELTLETELTEEQREYLEMVRTSTKSLLTVINDVLDLSKIEAGKLVFQSQVFDLSQLARDTLRSFSHVARHKSVELKEKIASELPPWVAGDPGRLRQVLVNLIDNALKFTDSGSVSLSVETDGDGIALVVTDTGAGIPEDDQRRIFESFVQASNSAGRGGSGLGLAVASRLVQQMGGELWLESTPGEGSRFGFTAELPACEAAVEPSPVSRRLPAQGLEVLLAEDHPISRALAERLLAKLGYRVRAVESGRAALAALEEARYDVVLMDVEMPRLDGLATTRRIRGSGRDYADIPIIALTANAMEGDEQRCLAAGMNGYVSKPFDRETLLEAIGRVLPAHEPAGGAGDGEDAELPLDEFRQLIDGDLRRLRGALDRGDAEAVERVAHGLAGAAGVWRAESIKMLLRSVLERARAGELASVRPLLEDLERAVVGLG